MTKCMSKQEDLAQEALLAHPDLKSDLRLQTGLVLNLITFMADTMDADGSVEDIIKPLDRAQKILLQTEDEDQGEKITKRLKSALRMFETNMLSDRSNPELEAKFYFNHIIAGLRALPLECLDSNLNSIVLTLALVLLSISAHKEVSEPLLEIVASSLNPVFRPVRIFEHLNGARVMLWLARLGYYKDNATLEKVFKLIAQNLTRNVVENRQRFPDFDESVKRLAKSFESTEDTSVSYKVSLAAVCFLEALETPMVKRDASQEKVDVCRQYFTAFSASFKRGFSLKSERKLLTFRAAKPILTVNLALPDGERKEDEFRFLTEKCDSLTKVGFALLDSGGDSSKSEQAVSFFRMILREQKNLDLLGMNELPNELFDRRASLSVGTDKLIESLFLRFTPESLESALDKLIGDTVCL